MEMRPVSDLIDNIEIKLNEADKVATSTKERLTHSQVFEKVRESFKEGHNR